jgi:valyl-tRNA synthetase
VSECLDAYRFNEAANSIYEFVWHEFCDWYIETVKPSIGDKASQTILYKILEKSLRMLHPFMPFITEEIWRRLPATGASSGESIMLQPWPHVQKEMISAQAEDEMKRLIQLVTAMRNIRAVWNIDPREEMSAIVNMRAGKKKDLIMDNADLVKHMARVADLKVGGHAKPKNAAVSVIGSMEVYVPLEGLIDFEKEKARLKKDEIRLAAELHALLGRLKDKEFLSKAPEEVVEKQKARKLEIEAQMKRLRENLKEIAA